MHVDPRSNPIICGVDRSEESQAAAMLGASLGHALGLPLVLAHFIRPMHVATGGGVAAPALHGAVEDRAWELLQRLAARSPETAAAQGLVQYGDPVDALVALAEQHAAALLVVGSRRRGTLARVLAGSLSKQLIRRAPCPVLVVPAAVGDGWLVGDGGGERPILCGYDGTEEASAALGCSVSVASALEAPLLIAHVSPPPDGGFTTPHPVDVRAVVAHSAAGSRLLREAAESLAGLVDVRTVHLQGDVAAELEALADESGALLVATGSRGRGPLAAALAGSTSRELAGSASRPVLVCPSEATVSAGPLASRRPARASG